MREGVILTIIKPNKITELIKPLPTKIETPDNVKEFFKDYIFPCQQNKKPAVPQKTSWQVWEGETKNITLAGLHCGKAGLVVFDFDIYKPEFKNSKEAQALYKKIKKLTPFKQTTQSGGEHYFFKQPEGQSIYNKKPCPGVEIRATGGYVCLYEMPFLSDANIESFNDFYNLLPVFPHGILKGIIKEKPTPGPGKTNEWLNAGFGTFANTIAEDIIKEVFTIAEGYKKTPGNTGQEEAKKKLAKSLEDGLNRQKDKLIQGYTEFLKATGQLQNKPSDSTRLEKKANKAHNTKADFKPEKIHMEDVKYISQLKFPAGGMTIMPGISGRGKTTTTLKALTDHWKETGKPYAYFGRENSISRFIIKKIRQFEGKQEGEKDDSCHFFWPRDYKKPEMVPVDIARPALKQAAMSGDYSAIIIDPFSHFAKSEKNPDIVKEALYFLEDLHPETALIVTSQLSKDVKEKELIQHIRGGTDFVALSEVTYYLREGKNPKERVIIKLKDRPSGELSGGFITRMDTPDSNMQIEPVEGDPAEILRQYGKPFPKDTGKKDSQQDKEDAERGYIAAIQTKVRYYPKGTWKMNDYKEWATNELGLPQQKIYPFFRRAGFFSKVKEKGGFSFVFWK